MPLGYNKHNSLSLLTWTKAWSVATEKQLLTIYTFVTRFNHDCFTSPDCPDSLEARAQFLIETIMNDVTVNELSNKYTQWTWAW